ncbi:MAG: rod shape-determining protein MreC [Alphaproteobacteria bacterium]|nr:rod shape-determining protein MreC [Alphaproteobacteria bacterium]
MDFCKPNIILPIKSFIHECIKLPDTINKLTNMQKENDILQSHVANLERKLKLIEQQHSICNKLNQNIKKFNALDQNNIEQVLGFEHGIFNSSLIISISNNANKEGYIVISDGLIGIVISSSDNIGLVRTITDSNLYIPVKTKSGSTLVLRGTNNNELVSVAIKQYNKININIGDILYTSGEGGMFPPNIPVSKITQVDLNKQEIKSCPIVELSNLEFVTLRKSVKMLVDNE